MDFLLIISILFPVISGALTSVFKFKTDKARNIYTIICTCLNSFVILYIVLTFKSNDSVLIFKLSDKLPIEVFSDGMSRLFAALIAFLWPLATCYAFEYMRHEERQTAFFSFYLMTYGITAGIAFSANLVTLYFFYEFLTLVTLPIVMHGMRTKNIAAGKKYVLYSMGGAAFAFLGMIVISVYTNTTAFTFGGVVSRELIETSGNVLRLFFIFAAFGFGVKAAIFPFCGWLPTASIAPTPVTALLHAVAVVNAGVFAIMRITYYSFGTELLKGSYAQYILLIFALITILFGSS
ncbi:MAG: proton-conducting membrane transporter, partial [Lachnospiraceae bacterium]|nr:proton-conducting membrane transporter [Lachnospiraceae bacterium]